MNENLDLTKILNGCPEGTEFYSPLFGKVKFSYIYGSRIGIVCVRMHKLVIFNPAGKYKMTEMKCSDNWGNYLYSDECLLFPSKDQRDWSKFTAPWHKKTKFDPETLKPFDKVLVKRYDDVWVANILSYYHNIVHPEHPNISYLEFITISNGTYRRCIPYNDETKYLIGTNDEAPEFYRYWED